jgi:hypothetical protein
MKYCYFSSKKITHGSCLYAIIQWESKNAK